MTFGACEDRNRDAKDFASAGNRFVIAGFFTIGRLRKNDAGASSICVKIFLRRAPCDRSAVCAVFSSTGRTKLNSCPLARMNFYFTVKRRRQAAGQDLKTERGRFMIRLRRVA
jgi:hypothetical protein